MIVRAGKKREIALVLPYFKKREIIRSNVRNGAGLLKKQYKFFVKNKIKYKFVFSWKESKDRLMFPKIVLSKIEHGYIMRHDLSWRHHDKYMGSTWVTLWLVTLWHQSTTMSQVYKITKKIIWKRKKKDTCNIMVGQCHQCHQPQCHPSISPSI